MDFAWESPGTVVAARCSDCSACYFGLIVNEHCRQCRAQMQPFLVRCSLVDANQAPNSILLKPSIGSFIWDYNFGDDLHIGVSNEVGDVMSYDKHGLRIDHAGCWKQCLPLLDCSDLHLSNDAWNNRFSHVTLETPCWSATRMSDWKIDDWLETDEGDLSTPGPSISTHSDDTDRDIDRREFLRQRLKIFKEHYRETAHESEEASKQQGFEEGFKRCAKFCRQLGKAKGALKALSMEYGSEEIDEIAQRIEACLDDVRNAKKHMYGFDSRDEIADHRTEEFNLAFANEALSQYDEDDMELFLGQEVRQQEEIEGDKVPDDKKMNGKQFEKLFDASEKEAEAILRIACDLLHSRGVCDGFIYA